MKHTLHPALAVALLSLVTAGCADESAAPTAPVSESRVLGAHGGGIPGAITFTSERDDPPGEQGEVYVMNADGSGVTRLTFHLATGDGWSDWSPDGRRIAFTSGRTGNREIWAMNSDGSNQINLTNNAGVDAAPVYSPNGRQIAFHSNRDGNFELYLMGADGSDPTRLTHDRALDLWPDWSPNGKEIVFSRNYDIAILNVATGEVRMLVEHSAREDMPVFSPNGKQIAFMSTRDGYPSIFVVDVDGSNLRNLTPRPSDASGAWFSFFPAWSKNGQQIYFSSERPGTADVDVFVMNADGSGVVQLTNAPGWDYAPAAR
jgi:Tol biopolymer transport system component